MAEQTFETFVKKEQQRLAKLREDALDRRKSIDDELAGIDKEMKAINAYVAAKTGKPPRATGTGKRRTGQREAILAVVNKHPDGIARANILKTMGVKGDKSAEQSVSNALANLKKAGKIGAKDGKYLPQ
jgi:hypothetical protein